MKLKAARLCIECDEVFEGRECPACGSGESWPIILWLNYDPEKGRALLKELSDVPAD